MDWAYLTVNICNIGVNLSGFYFGVHYRCCSPALTRTAIVATQLWNKGNDYLFAFDFWRYWICLFVRYKFLKLQNSQGIIAQAVAALGKRSLIIMLSMYSFFGNLRSDLFNYQSAFLRFAICFTMVTFSYILERKNIAGFLDKLLGKLANRSWEYIMFKS